MFIFTILAAIGEASHSGSEKEVELMKKIKADDADALKKLYELYEELLFGLIISIVKKQQVAEDVLREVFVNVWQKAHTFSAERDNVYSWLVTLSRNKAIDRIRSEGYKTQDKASESVHSPAFKIEGDKIDPFQTTIHSDRTELVKKALEEIPEPEREVLKIAYYRGMTQSEISDHLDIPPATVKMRTRQGMIKLRNILESSLQQNE